MAISPSSSVQRAREQLAERLRDIRLDAGLTGRALADLAHWHESKTSRIEAARQAPSEDDIRAWCRVCDADNAVPDLIAASRSADSMYLEWRRLQPAGMRSLQEGTVTAPSEIVQYAKAFEKLRALAVRGEAARELIAKAIAAL